MGKGDRRGKNNPGKLPELAPIMASKRKQYREGQRFARPTEDPRTTVLAARCKQMRKASTRDERAAAAHPAAGSPLGMVLLHMHEPQPASRLWGVWQSFCMAERAYRVRILGMTGSPANAAIAMLPERVEVEESLSSDIRSSEEKDADAIKTWERWRGFVGRLEPRRRTLLHGAECGNGRELWHDGGPTVAGILTSVALEALAELAEA